MNNVVVMNIATFNADSMDQELKRTGVMSRLRQVVVLPVTRMVRQSRPKCVGTQTRRCEVAKWTGNVTGRADSTATWRFKAR